MPKAVIKKGNKKVIALSVLNKTYYVNLLYVNAISLQHFNTKASFEELDKELQAKIKQYIRDLVINDEHISNQSIEEKIFLHFLSNKLQKEIKSLEKCQ
jgi:hypothetical protein